MLRWERFKQSSAFQQWRLTVRATLVNYEKSSRCVVSKPDFAYELPSDPDMSKGILRSEYRIILISPEMLQLTMFKEQILKNETFARNILSVVLDEAHCLSHWGADFRKHYNSLGTIRGFLPPKTPIIAVTATLTARVRRDLQSKLLLETWGRSTSISGTTALMFLLLYAHANMHRIR